MEDPFRFSIKKKLKIWVFFGQLKFWKNSILVIKYLLLGSRETGSTKELDYTDDRVLAAKYAANASHYITAVIQ